MQLKAGSPVFKINLSSLGIVWWRCLFRVLHGNSKTGLGMASLLKFLPEVSAVKGCFFLVLLKTLFFHFLTVKAFHLKFDEMKLDNNVAKWSVEIIELSRSKRHLDRANLLKFWSKLDQHIIKYKQNVVRF